MLTRFTVYLFCVCLFTYTRCSNIPSSSTQTNVEAFATGQYRNLFAELGYNQQQITK